MLFIFFNLQRKKRGVSTFFMKELRGNYFKQLFYSILNILYVQFPTF